MKYYNIDQELITCPYGLQTIGDQLLHVDKSAVVMSLSDYYTIDPAQYINFDMLFLYEWSGFLPIPDTFPIKTFVFYHNYSLDSKQYYPHWLIYVGNIYHKYADPTPTYPIACACRNFNNGRLGKIYNYQKLKEKSYYADILITKFKSIEPFESIDLDQTMLNNFMIDYNSWQVMNTDELSLVNSMSTVDLPVYTDSLFAIVAETYIQQSILSEKTYKTFLAGQIPILCAAKGAVAHLRQQGFDMFDDIVDHSYDSIDDWQERIDKMHQSLDCIVYLNHTDILEKTKARRLANAQHLKSKEVHKILVEPIVTHIIS
jgi:hypothetical protein